jgi:hypothetical protein
VAPPSKYTDFLDNLDNMLNTVDLDLKRVLPEEYNSMKNELSIEKFFSLLNTIHTNSQNKPYLVKEFRDAVKKIMPEELKTGKYKRFGKLMIRIDELLIPAMDKGDLKINQKRQVSDGIFDVIETTSFMLELIKADLDNDKKKIAEISNILQTRLNYLDKYSKSDK